MCADLAREKGVHHITVQCMWMWMFWFFLLQPVSIPVTALIPIFLLPMAGVLSTLRTCGCYFNENMALFVLSSMLILLLNNSGADRRIALSLICSGDNCQFSGKRLVFKCSVAAFFLSMFSNRLIISSTIMQYITPALTELQASTASSRATEPDYNEMRYIINNAIQTASSIGSIAIMHSAYASLCFRTIFCESAPRGQEYPDIFNYFQYSAFAFPVAFIMFVLNFAYHMILINKLIHHLYHGRCVCKAMSANSMTELRNSLMKNKTALPRRVSLHEKLTVFFMIFALVIFFLRWSTFLNMGWADFARDESSPQIPRVKDATVAAIFVIALHILPKGYAWLNYFSAEKKSELPPLRPESAILWWRFVDKNLNYGYIFLIGSGVALQVAIKHTGLDDDIVAHFGSRFTDHEFSTSLFLVCLVAVIMSNAMSGVAACVSFLPLILSMAAEPPPDAVTFRSIRDWPVKMYLGALGVGLASSFGFMFPFLYTPAYYCHYTGKVPMKKMAKYSIGSVIICLIILWLALMYYAPVIWDPEGTGIKPVAAPGKAAGNSTNSSMIL
ncbi:protein I'm not dead yet [Manduca sexta]|uniref:protein I'm not dead yet n=1 Tax=Manduca sexta TaxID=7130 RepID=UPI00188E5400|nr:protein I'm not dead yet [Manduca sexta]